MEMKTVRVVGLLGLLVLLLFGLLPGIVSAATPPKTIYVKQSTLEMQEECTTGIKLWHFVINQIANTETDPAFITVHWANGFEADVPLTKVSGPVAHYEATAEASQFPQAAGSVVTDAWTDIYAAWDGEFNLSHIECDGTNTAGKSGIKFWDLNGNHANDGEPGLGGWTIYVDYDDDSIRDPGEPFAVSDADGVYSITGIVPGTWKVREEAQTGWTCTFPAGGYYEETFIAGRIETGNDFGNYDGGGGGGPGPEVGGVIFPVNKTAILAPWLALAVVIIAGATIATKRHLVRS